MIPAIIYVVWKDASKYGSTYAQSEAMKLSLTTVQEVGFLVSEDDEVLKIAMEFDSEERTFKDISVIPKRSILLMQRLKKAKGD